MTNSDPYYLEQVAKVEQQMVEAEQDNRLRRAAEAELTQLQGTVIALEELLNYEFFANGGCAPYITIAVTNGLRHWEEHRDERVFWRVILFPYQLDTPIKDQVELAIRRGLPLSEMCGQGFYPLGVDHWEYLQRDYF